MRAQRRVDMAAIASSSSEEVPVLNTNGYRAFTLYGKFYLLKAFVLEEIYLGKLPIAFQNARRENNMDLSTKTYEMRNNKNWQDNNSKRKTLKATETKT